MKNLKTFTQFINEGKLPFEIEKALKSNRNLNWEENSDVVDDIYDEHKRAENPLGYVAFDRNRGIEYTFKTWNEGSTYYIELTEDDNIIFAENYASNEKRFYDQDCENILGFSI
jgi:hypothetical protein